MSHSYGWRMPVRRAAKTKKKEIMMRFFSNTKTVIRLAADSDCHFLLWQSAAWQ